MNNLINILSIDLDAFWSGPETIYINNQKALIQNEKKILNYFNKLSIKEKRVGIDHNEILLMIDKYPNNKMNVYNFDAHHDLYALNYNVWLNPLFIRGKCVDIGNMFFQLIREDKIQKYTWLVNDETSIDLCKKNVVENIGLGFMNKTEIMSINNISDKIQFDMLFISISPEWIPNDKIDWIIQTLAQFINIDANQELDLRNKINKRWNLKDDNSKINKDRFYLENNYV